MNSKYTLLKIMPSSRNTAGPDAVNRLLDTIYNTLSSSKKINKAALELEMVNNNIYFYLFIPTTIVTFITTEIYANYIGVEIIKQEQDIWHDLNYEDYHINSNLFKARKIGIYPFNDFRSITATSGTAQTDFLSSLAQALTNKGSNNERFRVQIIIKPLNERAIDTLNIINIWQISGIFGENILWRYRTLPWLLRIIFSPLMLYFGIKAWQGRVTAEDNIEEKLTKAKEKHKKTYELNQQKLQNNLFHTTLRTIYLTEKNNHGQTKLRGFATILNSLTAQNKWLKISNLTGQKALEQINNRISTDKFTVLSSPELATFWHLPTEEMPIAGMAKSYSLKLEPPHNLPLLKNNSTINTIGQINYQNNQEIFGLLADDRMRHTYIVGKTGMGKSVLLENMIYNDIIHGKGVAIVDPHGDLADKIVNSIPSNRTNDTVIFDPSDKEFPVSFNMLEVRDDNQIDLVASGVVSSFKKLFGNSWGPRLEYILRNVILTLISNQGQTLLGIPLILTNKQFRQAMTKTLTDPILINFWKNEFEVMQDRQRTEAVAPILNKVGQFLSSKLMRNIVGQPKSSIDLRFAMDRSKIIIINLSKGNIGEDNSSLLGSMIITKFQIDAMSRSNIPETERTEFFLYVDEFQNFATESFASILSEARKYHLALIMANQYISQMIEEVREAVFGNCGTIISFQVGANDSHVLTEQLSGGLKPDDLMNLPKYNIYLKELIEGMPSKTFSAQTLPPTAISKDAASCEKLKRYVRERYAKPRQTVADNIFKFSNKYIIKPKLKSNPKLTTKTT